MPSNIKCVIVDDEEMASNVIKLHLAHVSDFAIVGIYHSAVEAFLAIDQMEVDVLFLDIQMPNITGLEMIKMLKKKPLVVMTTAHREFALEGFELEVVDYLMKPIGLQRFLKTISRLKKLLHSNIRDDGKNIHLNTVKPELIEIKTHIFIKSNKAYQKIELDTILHVESIKNHIKIVTDTENHISLSSLTDFALQLPENFLRVHRSFIINVNQIEQFDKYSITNRHQRIPIGRTFKDDVLSALEKLKI